MLEFGTDGVRGRANSELTADFAVKLGQSVAQAVSGSTFVVGRDTRLSGTMLQAAFSAGLCSKGASVLDLGVIPSPGVAFVCSRLRLPGAVISASHNPYYDNGIKVISAAGTKLSEEVEASIEALVDQPEGTVSSNIGVITDARHLAADYREFLAELDAVPPLNNLRLVIDTGHGAASSFARDVFRRHGAEVVIINDSPDGVNINANAGSTHLDALRATVLAEGADLGLAFDGDADRVMALDECGNVLDGDFIMAILAKEMKARGTLRNNAVSVTVMSNLGLTRALADAGIAVVETDVGDRNVAEAIRRRDLSLGGEQSGHVILADIATTGDGMLTGLLFSGALAAKGGKASVAAQEAMTRFPQVLNNVRYAGDARARLAEPQIARAVREASAVLGNQGRVLVRPSGTEPVIRIMVEALDHGTAETIASELAAVISA